MKTQLTACDRKTLATLRVISLGRWVSPYNESQLSEYRLERLVKAGYAHKKIVDGCGNYYQSK